MTRGELRAAVIAILLTIATGIGLVAWHDASLRRAHAADVGRYKRMYQAAKVAVRTDSVEVVKVVTSTRTLRDTVLERLTDTALVREYVYRTDTLRAACLRCVASASQLGAIGDTTLAKVAANERRWYDRLGVSAGYGVLLDRAGDVRHGVTVSASVRLWP